MIARSIRHDTERKARHNAFIERFKVGDGDLWIAVKDVVDIAGRRTSLGSAAIHGAPK